MKTIIRIKMILFSAYMLTSSCCDKLLSDDLLTLEKKKYNGKELRIDGYYYHVSSIDGQINSVTFFYNNGTKCSMTGDDSGFGDLNYWDGRIIMPKWIDFMKQEKKWWGVFQVDKENIVFQHWGNSLGGGLPIATFYGTIINDTTFRITSSINSQTEKILKRDDIYHFRQFSPKPDSTNVFIP